MRVLAWMLLAALFGSQPAPAGQDAPGVTVTGEVLRAPAAVASPPAPARYRTRRAPAQESEIPAADCGCDPGRFAVVHLTGENLPAPVRPLQPPVMAQKERRFEPSVLAIPVGGEVGFPNRDPFFHNVFSYSKTRTFDLGRYPAGETAAVTFPDPGVIPIFCEIHYSMRAYVHVVDSPYFAVSDELRHFEIAGVLPGEYTLHVWQENLPEITMPLVVGAEPLHLEIP